MGCAVQTCPFKGKGTREEKWLGVRHLLQALWLASNCGQSATVLQDDSMMVSSFPDATGSGCAHRREAERCGSVHIGEKLTDVVLLPAVAPACESGTQSLVLQGKRVVPLRSNYSNGVSQFCSAVDTEQGKSVGVGMGCSHQGRKQNLWVSVVDGW